MKKPKKQKQAAVEAGKVVKFDEAGMPQLDVWLEDETIWLTQKQMGLLFGCAPQNITYHLHEIYKIGELEAVSTCKDFLQVQIEGGKLDEASTTRILRVVRLEKRMTAAERSIDTIIYTLMPALPDRPGNVHLQYRFCATSS